MDTGDGTDSQKLLYIFIRVVSLGQPAHLFGGVRRELGAKGRELFSMYKDFITGEDMNWGYDLEIKLKTEVFASNSGSNDSMDIDVEQKADADSDEYDEENANEWKEPSYIKLTKQMKQQQIKFGMDYENTVSETASICSDKAPNFYGANEGFEGHRGRDEKDIMDGLGKEVRTLRNHCVNHKIDLDAREKDTDADILLNTETMLKSVKRFWVVVGNYKVCHIQKCINGYSLSCFYTDVN